MDNQILNNMNENIKVQYNLLVDRYIKMAWTHKIQEIQADLYIKESIKLKRWVAIVNALTTTSAIASLFSILEIDWIVPTLTAVLAAISSYLTFRYKEKSLEEKALENKKYAAKCRNFRNMYEALLTDIMSGAIADIKDIVAKREKLEGKENELFCGETAPHTTGKAVELASKALKVNRDSQTTAEEIKAILPTHLQV